MLSNMDSFKLLSICMRYYKKYFIWNIWNNKYEHVYMLWGVLHTYLNSISCAPICDSSMYCPRYQGSKMTLWTIRSHKHFNMSFIQIYLLRIAYVRSAVKSMVVWEISPDLSSWNYKLNTYSPTDNTQPAHKHVWGVCASEHLKVGKSQ